MYIKWICIKSRSGGGGTKLAIIHPRETRPLFFVDMIEKQNAIEMVIFMKNDTRKHTFRVEGKWATSFVPSLHADKQRSHYVRIDPGNTQASFFVRTEFLGGANDLGIDEHARGVAFDVGNE